MLLNDKLNEELERRKIVPETQPGFRSGRSTIDNIKILNYIVNREINHKGGKLYDFFADLTATLDKDNRELLSRIMEEKGINEILRIRMTKSTKKLETE